jgi:hypothetical protein
MSLPIIKNTVGYGFNTQSSVIIPLGFTPSVGNILVFGFASRLPVNPSTTLSSGGATWTKVAEQYNTGTSTTGIVVFQSGILVGIPGDSVLVNFVTTQHGAIVIAEIENVTGLDPATPVVAFGTSNPATAGPFTNIASKIMSVAFLARADGDPTDFFTNITSSDYGVDQKQQNGTENPLSTKQTLGFFPSFKSTIAARTVTGDMGGADGWASAMCAFIWAEPESDVETRAEIEARSWTLGERGVDLANHIKAGIERLITQFRKQPKLVAILTSWLESVQDLEGVFWDIHQIRDIDQATGVNLDTLGKIVGQLRGTLTDAQYRTWLKARILANRSRCTPDEILEILLTIEPNAELGIIESYPAGYVITAFGVTDDDPLGEIMSAVKPAGVSGELWTTTEPVAGLFEFADNAIVTDVAKGLADDQVTDPGGSMINISVLGL